MLKKDRISLIGIVILCFTVYLSQYSQLYFIIGLFIYGLLGLKAEKIIWIGVQEDKWVVRILSSIIIIFAFYLLIHYFKFI